MFLFCLVSDAKGKSWIGITFPLNGYSIWLINFRPHLGLIRVSTKNSSEYPTHTIKCTYTYTTKLAVKPRVPQKINVLRNFSGSSSLVRKSGVCQFLAFGRLSWTLQDLVALGAACFQLSADQYCGNFLSNSSFLYFSTTFSAMLLKSEEVSVSF